MVRAGFRALLEGIAGVSVVAEAQNGREAWDLIWSLRPALAVVDVSMPLLNGFELTTRVAAQLPSTRVLILSMHGANDYILRAIKAGAAGYLLKDSRPIELERAIRAVERGETYFNLAEESDGAQLLVGRQAESTRFERLTPRQRELLQLIGEGYSTKMIARRLGISVKTAEAHRTQLMERLDLHDIAAVVRYAIAVGIVSAES